MNIDTRRNQTKTNLDNKTKPKQRSEVGLKGSTRNGLKFSKYMQFGGSTLRNKIPTSSIKMRSISKDNSKSNKWVKI